MLAAANNTEYGLVVYVFTDEITRAHRVTDALEYGMVAINAVRLTTPIPFGEIKQSGVGPEDYSLDEFTTREIRVHGRSRSCSKTLEPA